MLNSTDRVNSVCIGPADILHQCFGGRYPYVYALIRYPWMYGDLHRVMSSCFRGGGRTGGCGGDEGSTAVKIAIERCAIGLATVTVV